MAAADVVWREQMRRKIDFAQHRLFVLSVTRPTGANSGPKRHPKREQAHDTPVKR